MQSYRQYKYIIIFLLNGICIGHVHSQNLMYPFEHYNASHGLQAPALKIMQDEFGFLWLGTTDGLTRFDGKSFKVFRNKIGDPHSIPNNIINDLIVDSNNVIWIATNGGLCYYSYEDSQFHQVESAGGIEQLDPFRIYGVAIDKFGSIWFATRTSVHQVGLHLEIIKTFKVSSTKELIIKAIYFDSSEHMYIGTNINYLYRIDVCTGDITRSEVQTKESKRLKVSTTVHPILPYVNDTLILGSWFGGLNKAYVANNKINIISVPNSCETCVQKNIVTSIAMQSDSLWWVGTYGCGLALFNPSKGEYIRHIKFSLSDPNGISNNYINYVYLDRSKILWIATDEGLDKYDSRAHQFHSVKIPIQDEERSVYRKPSCIIEDRDDRSRQSLWIVVPGIGLYHYNKKSQHMVFQKTIPGYKGNLQDDRLYTMFYNLKNELCVGMNSGLYHVDFKKKFCKPIQFPHNTQVKNIRKILQSKDGAYWITSSANGVYYYNVERNFVKHFFYNPENIHTGLRDDHIFCLMEDYKNQIWMGTQNKGLGIVNPKSFQFQYFEKTKADASSLPDNGIFDLYEDADHFIWIATENGLARMDPTNHKLKIFTTSEGLINNIIYSITPDNQGKLWLSTNSGLSVLNPKDGSIQNYSRWDGLPSNHMDGTTLATEDGLMVFSSNGMISICKQENISLNTITPPVIITAVKVFGQEIPLIRVKGKLKEVHITYQKNIFYAEFAALNYSNSMKNKYAYMVEGHNDYWIYSGNQSSVTLNNLPGGTYTFKVKASNNDGLWNGVGDQIKLIIHPPFWQTNWFYFLSLFLIAVIAYAYYRIRINQFFKLQEIRIGIARDLHDEVGSTLSSIHMASSMAEESLRKGRFSMDKFTLIQTASKKAMDMMNEIVWSIQPENDSLDRLISKLREYSSDILESAGIEFKFEVNNHSGLFTIPLGIRKDLVMVFREAVNNIAKYSAAMEASISVVLSKYYIILEIKDNGRGFDIEDYKAGNGLRNMRARAIRLKADLKIISSLGNGTKIYLKIPLTP